MALNTNQNWQELERRAATRAAAALRSSMRSVIGETFTKRSGQMEESNVSARFKNGLVDRLVITSPRYSFIEHYGFEQKTEQVKATQRRDHEVRAHHVGDRYVDAHVRRGGLVKAFSRNVSLEGKGHISEALDRSNILETLATELARSRAVLITSQIRF